MGRLAHRRDNCLFCDSHRIHLCLRAAGPQRIEAMIGTSILLTIVLLLLAYLVFALLRPEKF